MVDILLNNPRFDRCLENADVQPFYYPMEDIEWMRLFHLIDRQFLEVGTCDHTFEKLDTALSFTSTSEENKKDIKEFIQLNCGCDCEIMFNLFVETEERLSPLRKNFETDNSFFKSKPKHSISSNKAYKPIIGLLEKPTTVEDRKVLIFCGKELSGKTYLANILCQNLTVFKIDGKKSILKDHFVLNGAENADVILIDDVILDRGILSFGEFLERKILSRDAQILRQFEEPIRLKNPHVIITTNFYSSELGELITKQADEIMDFHSEFDFYKACEYFKIPINKLRLD